MAQGPEAGWGARSREQAGQGCGRQRGGCRKGRSEVAGGCSLLSPEAPRVGTSGDEADFQAGLNGLGNPWNTV